MVSQDLRLHGSLQARRPVFEPVTEAECESVRRQLDRILTSPAFHNSKRYASVLKFVVEQTLDGESAQLKERTIGVEVFHRPADYDTADHVVRSAMSEVRKRLAQYYQEDHRAELRIEVLPGSYVPQFRWIDDVFSAPPAPLHSAPVTAPDAPVLVAVSALAAESRTPRRIPPAAWIVAGAVALACVVVGALALRQRSAFESFWRPVLTSRAPVLLCVGNLEGGRGFAGNGAGLSPSLTLREFHNSDFEMVHVSDAMTLARFAGLMQARGRQYQLISQSDATFTDLQKGPAILVGLMNNSWTERLVPQLRFTVEQISPHQIAIRDRKNPANTEWTINYETPYLDLTKDYAIVLRMADPKTEQMVVVAAGITVFGTFAAGEFLTDPNEMKKMAAVAPPGWEGKNVELVLSTDVIRGRSGPASIVAAQFW
jgi:hypothetical protein